MVAESDSTPDHYAWSVEISPAEVDAGTELTLKCQVALPPERDHSGLAVSIRDHDDAELAIAELTLVDGDVYGIDDIVLTAPLAEGEHIWRTVLIAPEKDGPSYDEISTEFSFLVKAHAVRLNVWGLPTAIVAGERFTLKAGIKCSVGCNLAGRELYLVDAGGVQIGTGKLLDYVWPGTSALYFAEVEGKAPLGAGNHQWEVRIPASGSGIPHAAGAFAFDVKLVDVPDFEVTIEAVDAGTADSDWEGPRGHASLPRVYGREWDGEAQGREGELQAPRFRVQVPGHLQDRRGDGKHNDQGRTHP